jgi:Tat protein translocase TatB subunit
MFNIGIPEMALIFIVALVVLGPEKLPEIARALGKGYSEFMRAMRDVRQNFDSVTSEFENETRVIRDPVRAVGKSIESAILTETEKEAPPPTEPKIADPSQKS